MNTKPNRATLPFAARGGCWALIAAAVALALLAMAAVVVVLAWGEFCSSPSQEELRAQEAFVRSRLPAARDVESGTADCDDDGDGYVSFTTDLTPTAARDAFLADQLCSPYTERDAGVAVKCRSGKSTVYVFFDSSRGDATEGELNLS